MSAVSPTNVLLLHPGPTADAIVTWTAPENSEYHVQFYFEILDTSPTGVIVSVYDDSH